MITFVGMFCVRALANEAGRLMSAIALQTALWSLLTLGQASFQQDFRQPLAEDRLALSGSDSAPFVRRETAGLRILMPAREDTPRRIGITPRFELEGDFQAAVTFDLGKIGKPATGQRVGIGLYARTSGDEGVSLWWMRRGESKASKDVLLCQRAYLDASGKRRFENHEVPAQPAGRYTLQIKRQAGRLTFSGARGKEKLAEFHACEFDASPVTFLRAGGDNFDADTLLEFRLVDLRLRAVAFRDPRPPSLPASRNYWLWVFWITALVGPVLAAHAGWKRYQRWSRPSWEQQ